jgi:hypothetical protein
LMFKTKAQNGLLFVAGDRQVSFRGWLEKIRIQKQSLNGRILPKICEFFVNLIRRLRKTFGVQRT